MTVTGRRFFEDRDRMRIMGRLQVEDVPLGFLRLVVPAGQVARVETAPVEKHFRPRYLVVAADVAPKFVVDQIWVAGEPQLASRESGLPCALFTPEVSPEMQMVTAPAGTRCEALVRNVSSTDCPFVAYLCGALALVR